MAVLEDGFVNSRAKGQRGELETAKLFREYGFDDARRGQQFAGGGESPDVVGLPGYHVENKLYKRCVVYKWLDQAKRDSKGTGLIPLVTLRVDRQDPVAILPLRDFLEIIAK